MSSLAQVVEGVVQSIKLITKEASTRVAQFAFKHALANGRKKVTAVHKANIMFESSRYISSCSIYARKMSDGLFLECCKEVAALYPNIQFVPLIVDNTSMQLVDCLLDLRS